MLLKILSGFGVALLAVVLFLLLWMAYFGNFFNGLGHILGSFLWAYIITPYLVYSIAVMYVIKRCYNFKGVFVQTILFGLIGGIIGYLGEHIEMGFGILLFRIWWTVGCALGSIGFYLGYRYIKNRFLQILLCLFVIILYILIASTYFTPVNLTGLILRSWHSAMIFSIAFHFAYVSLFLTFKCVSPRICWY